jgi:hypothetical protein
LSQAGTACPPTLDTARILEEMHPALTIAMQLRMPKANFVALINVC